MTNPLSAKRIVLGVTGSIAVYKAVDLASKLAQSGAVVDTILTDAAGRFVTPLTFQSVTGCRAYGDDDLWGAEAHVLHIGLGHAADLLVVAPATANTLAKLAHGRADDLLSITALAANCPLLVAPAMDGGMYTHPATQASLATLTARGAQIVGPERGHLASGLVAMGRLTEPSILLGHIRRLLSRGGPLSGRRVVVTAGGTREALDPVRFLTNRSSGKQGMALAQAAQDMGADVVLINASREQAIPVGIEHLPVESAQEMHDVVLQACTEADALLMAAAVADFRPAAKAEQKIKKEGGLPSIELTANPDILLSVAEARAASGYPRVVVGFAAETQDLLENARAKVARKGLDLIVANDVGASDAGFGVDTNRVTLVDRTGRVTRLPLMSKADVAATVVDDLAARLEKKAIE